MVASLRLRFGGVSWGGWLWYAAMAAAVAGLGVYFRLAGLSETSMHGDGVFHDFCRNGISVSDLFSRWAQVIGPSSGQMPPAAALTKWFLDVFHLPPVRENVILPSALLAILTMPVALWVGWRLGGAVFGLLLMGVVALNPTYVGLSRMAYFYHPCILGAFVALWCLLESWESVKQRRTLRWSFHCANALSTALMVYATAGSWVFVALVAVFHITCAIINRLKHGIGVRDLVIIFAAYVVIGVPLLIVPWGVPAILGMSGNNEATAYWRRIFETSRQVPILKQVGYPFLSFAWGWTPWRAAWSVAVVIAGLATTFFLARRKKEWLLPLGVFLIGLILLVVAIKMAVWPFGLRRVSALWPAWFVLLATGLYGCTLVSARIRWILLARICGAAPVLLAFGLWVHADWLISRACGLPIPYRQIDKWVDSHFVKGTPMVTDRFYTAMCEFNQSDPTTNVVVISTVPNELPEIQEKTRFREVTRQYLEENPDAFFYWSGHLCDRPEVVPWDWPGQYFRRSKEFRDDYTQALVSMGQAFQEVPGAMRWPVIYYNTLQDVVDIQRAKGAKGFVMWGPDWRPVQTQDYRLWRLLLTGDGALNVYSLPAQQQDLVLEVIGVAVGGDLRVQIGDQTLVFGANQIVQQKYQVKLQPGMNSVSLRCRGAVNARLLVAKVVVK